MILERSTISLSGKESFVRLSGAAWELGCPVFCFLGAQSCILRFISESKDSFPTGRLYFWYLWASKIYNLFHVICSMRTTYIVSSVAFWLSFFWVVNEKGLGFPSFFFFFLRFYIFIFREREGERGRETWMCGCFLCASNWGPGL